MTPHASLRIRQWTSPGADAPLPEFVRPRGLVTAGTLDWRPGDRPGRWHARVDLGPLPAQHLTVPCLIPGAVDLRGWTASFGFGGPEGSAGRIPLSPIPASAEFDALPDWPKASVGPVAAGAETLVGGLDCAEAETAIEALVLDLDVVTDGAPPDVGLLVSDRARRIDVVDTGGNAPALHLPTHSQKTRDPAIAAHVCSPMSVAMVLGGLGYPLADLEAFARRCEHPQHGRLFGLWPLNLARAHEIGATGIVRQFEDVGEAAALLAAGVPIVASIRFAADALGGAPLPGTGGHLVVLRGLEDEVAVVHDPAAPDDASVPRRYDRAEFLSAWLADRGVGYVLWPHTPEAR